MAWFAYLDARYERSKVALHPIRRLPFGRLAIRLQTKQ